jgi:ABC-type sugar transport system ATPase subunit
VSAEITPDLALEADGVEMRFGRTAALKGISLGVGRGTIHALVGENGAGKSTFLGVIAGRIRATRGTVKVRGQRLPPGDPRGARRLGVASIYQELAVVPAMTAVANVFLGVEEQRGYFVDDSHMRIRFEELAQRMGVHIRPDAVMRDLSVGDQQSVEIMRGLQAEARLLLLDEPTSALERAERERLFTILRDLKQDDVTSVFVTHDLDDVLALADMVSVFRDGQLVETAPLEDWTKTSMVAAMLGRAVNAMPRRTSATKRSESILKVRSLEVPGILHDVNFSVSPGEIVGLGGLAGSGRTSLLRALAGAGAVRAGGTLEIKGHPRAMPRSPAAAAELGIALLPENRKTDGLVMEMTALENICLPEFGGSGLGIFSRRAATARATAAAKAVGFDPKRLQTIARHLSGGNQQKLLLARWANRPLQVLLADEPTRGVDVGAKAEILQTLRRLASDGLSMIIASSELEELEALADRVLVLSAGELVATLNREAGEITASQILEAAFNVDRTAIKEGVN